MSLGAPVGRTNPGHSQRPNFGAPGNQQPTLAD
jgi:hypothetical protein